MEKNKIVLKILPFLLLACLSACTPAHHKISPQEEEMILQLDTYRNELDNRIKYEEELRTTIRALIIQNEDLRNQLNFKNNKGKES